MSQAQRVAVIVQCSMHPWDAVWLFYILSSLQPVIQKQLLAASRRRMLAQISSRDATVITLIHRQETLSLLGIPLARHIDIDDSQGVLRAIRATPQGKTIERDQAGPSTIEDSREPSG